MPRSFVRGTLGVLLALMFLLQAPGAGAAIEWCKFDPIVDVGGKRMHVYVSGPIEILDVANGPTVVEIQVPPGVPVAIVSTDQGFGHGWEVSFVESANVKVTNRGIEVRVRTYVPADADLSVKTEMADGSDVVLSAAKGKTNTWTSGKAWL
jgi:hypothetical protein